MGAPTSKESFATDEQRVDYRKKAFAKIDADGSGAISFDEWLNYSYQHICQMVATLDEKKADLGIDTKERFKEWCVKASRDRRSAEYKELYDLLLATFVEGDRDQDGRVNAAELDKTLTGVPPAFVPVETATPPPPVPTDSAGDMSAMPLDRRWPQESSHGSAHF